MSEFIPCILKALPAAEQHAAAATAVRQNPANRAPLERLGRLVPGYVAEPAHLALLTTKYWGAGGVKLGVSFEGGTPADLQARILLHANAWAKSANVSFAPASAGNAQVRISRTAGGGYWSYLGTDILHIAAGAPTLNLDSFTMSTPDSEFFRVVRHEVGHTLGFTHEHLRKEIVARLDPSKTLAYFARTQGWSASEVHQQVLTPVDEAELRGTPHADTLSIMCYQLPASITTDGQPIAGGNDIDASDYALAATLYPRPGDPPPPSTGVTLAQVTARDDDVFRRLQTSFAQVRGARQVLSDGLAALKAGHAALFVGG